MLSCRIARVNFEPRREYNFDNITDNSDEYYLLTH